MKSSLLRISNQSSTRRNSTPSNGIALATHLSLEWLRVFKPQIKRGTKFHSLAKLKKFWSLSRIKISGSQFKRRKLRTLKLSMDRSSFQPSCIFVTWLYASTSIKLCHISYFTQLFSQGVFCLWQELVLMKFLLRASTGTKKSHWLNPVNSLGSTIWQITTS